MVHVYKTDKMVKHLQRPITKTKIERSGSRRVFFSSLLLLFGIQFTRNFPLLTKDNPFFSLWNPSHFFFPISNACCRFFYYSLKDSLRNCGIDTIRRKKRADNMNEGKKSKHNKKKSTAKKGYIYYSKYCVSV